MDNFDYKSYSGNNDFRGFLAKNAPYTLGYTGNDGNIDWNKVNTNGADTNVMSYAPGQATKVAADIKNLYGKWQQANASTIGSPTNYAASTYVAPATAVNYDIAGNHNAAYNEASSNQNPLYDKLLNSFLQDQSIQQQAQQYSHDTTVTGLNENLANTVAANAVTGQRTTEDTATNEGQIAQKQDQFQTDSGSQFASDRVAQAAKTAASGLTGGIGAQQAESAQAAHNTTEARTTQAAADQTTAQELVKARTFQDLATSNKINTTKTTEGTAAADFNLDNWIQASKVATEKERTQNQIDRNQAIAADTKAIAAQKFSTFLQSISDPGKVNATYQKYSGSFA